LAIHIREFLSKFSVGAAGRVNSDRAKASSEQLPIKAKKSYPFRQAKGNRRIEAAFWHFSAARFSLPELTWLRSESARLAFSFVVMNVLASFY
jgi:hypothetical protein